MNDERVERRRRFIINVAYWGIIAAFVYVGIKIMEPVLVPIIIAVLVAWALRGPINWLEKKTHIKKHIVALIVVIFAYVVLGTLITVLAVRVFGLLSDFFADVPDFYNNTIVPILNDLFVGFERICNMIDPKVMITIEESAEEIFQSLTGVVSSVSSTAISWVSGKAMSIPSLVIKTFITLIVTVFITMDFHKMVEFVSRQIPEKTKQYLTEIRNYTGGTLLKCLKSYIIIMFITFTELIIGLSILRVDNAPVIAGIIAVIDVMPVLGTGGVVIPWALISLITGDFFRAIGLIVMYVIVLVVRNIIEPKIVGSQVGLHPVITLASMFIGLHFFGIIGMFGFPIALSVIKNLNDKKIIHIFK